MTTSAAMPVRCSRCTEAIADFRPPDAFGMTAGYYYVKHGYWSAFSALGEVYVCDACMWQDSRYIALYGRHSRS